MANQRTSKAKRPFRHHKSDHKPLAAMPGKRRTMSKTRPSPKILGVGDGDALQHFKTLLLGKKKIIIISGAGISTNAGVDDYRTSSRTNRSSRRIFDSSAYSQLDSTVQLHTRLLEIFRSASKSDIIPFESFMEYLAQCNLIQRHYTQNIDCRSAGTKLPFLSQITTWIHGRLDRMMCHIYSQHTVEVTTDTFTDWVTAPCPLCQEEDLKRVSMGKRSHGCGFLRPKVYLYGPGELCLDEKEVLSNFNCDLREPVDAVLIVGTRLQIPDLKTFAQRLCKQTRRRKGIVAWINKESPKLGTSFESLLDFQLIGDCDDFASSFLE